MATAVPVSRRRAGLPQQYGGVSKLRCSLRFLLSVKLTVEPFTQARVVLLGNLHTTSSSRETALRSSLAAAFA